ncbi:hypothetical protein DICVIV_11304 [Dictyocaulus viviparus]|uniref:Uncharacterized protein n=1 Tax=Dictyocaulus viviparus TaxID=29172 RepID=A0A0D8XG71_DICVI|nr:hypothetical protein DICVIV_11304 [Dictyocaulus viviparus]
MTLYVLAQRLELHLESQDSQVSFLSVRISFHDRGSGNR